MKLNRRQFVIGSAAVAACTAAPFIPARASIRSDYNPLKFYNLHTGERISLRYRNDDEYFLSALDEANHFFRDHRTGKVGELDPRLFDHIYFLNSYFGTGRTIEIISGYRSPETNDMLANRSRGVARQSYHTKGMAIDLNISGVPVKTVHEVLVEKELGGAGVYTASKFVHLDTGPVRRWVGR